MNKHIYICTSYNDIQYILAHVVSSDVIAVIVVFNHKGIFDYFKSLSNSSFELFFFKNRLNNIYKFSNWLKEIKEIVEIWKFSSRYNNISVFTISLYFDLQSLMLLNFLRKNNTIFVFRSSELLSNFTKYQNDFKTKFWSFFYFTKFQKYITYQTIALGLDEVWIRKYSKDYLISTNPLLDPRINIYRFKSPTENPFILLLFSREEETLIGEVEFDSIIRSLQLKYKDFDVVVKGHPRVGLPNTFHNFAFNEIDINLPIELLDLTKCYKVFGLGSLALANIANSNIDVFSLVNFLPKHLINYQLDIIDYLKQQCEKVIFPHDLNKIN